MFDRNGDLVVQLTRQQSQQNQNCPASQQQKQVKNDFI